MRPKHVLIADDDASLVRILEVRFRKAGFESHACHDAMHALARIHKDPPDLVVLDISMPAGNGLAACEMLAADRRLCGIPVIIMSGRSDAATLERVRSLGAHYVLKDGDLWQNLRALADELVGCAQAV